MALRRDIPTAPGTRPDPRYETTYQASRGGHFKAPPKPTPGAGTGKAKK
ncbi:hypothetical protein [Streptomyces buecherae]|uniref:Uncharacterized protein n=1 Tax=Streptomyces buecherae TaxID=2763006 RepID=A0A7H8NKR6_9ACTN|nr:hypothetical protein [Streptomyces buecherae]QKW55040.1 hypothetical protein HUT08_36535 [Streptomyces buecherae]